MEWRELQQTGEFSQYIGQIWAIEQLDAPRFFAHASRLWTPDIASFARFAAGCGEIQGLFEGERLLACVFIEQVPEEAKTIAIHFSLLERCRNNDLAEKCVELRNRLFRRDVKRVRGWLLKKNRTLRLFMETIGFSPAGLAFDFGHYRGRVLRWELMELWRD